MYHSFLIHSFTGEVGGDNEGERGKGFQEHVGRTHRQNHRVVGSRVGSGDGWGGGKIETTVLEQQLKKKKTI